MKVKSKKKVFEDSRRLPLQVCFDAVDDLFSDTSVSRAVTIDNLRELRDEIDMKLEALK